MLKYLIVFLSVKRLMKMKEININIEGYNVNGVCVGCLNYNRKMFNRDEVKECYKLLGDIDVPDGLSIQVCWECLAAVKSVMRFKEQISNAFDILFTYSQMHTFLNSPDDLTHYATQRLTIQETQIHPDSETTDIKEEETTTSIKLEIPTEKDQGEIDTEVKTEDELYDNHSQDNDFIGADSPKIMSSDDDIQLSRLKREGKRKKKKRKLKDKKSREQTNKEKIPRRLKNLPSNLVELVTMTEEQMWEVRSTDVKSVEFQRLKYKCVDCVMTFNTQKLMEAHKSGKHCKKNEDVYQCDVCKAHFLTKENAAVHRRLHLSAYKCRQCGLITTMKKLVMAHECASGLVSYPCSVCDKTFSTTSKLAYHKTVTHQENPQCDCCGKIFANKMSLRYHLKILPLYKEKKPDQTVLIPCKGCDKVFHSKKSYRAHVVIHDGLSYPCPTCGKLFQWKRNLARHVRNHRERAAGNVHACRDCGKSFASRDCYNNHMRLSKQHAHESDYVHACHFCGKKFPTKWCMVDHIDWDHLKRIKYQCSVCFKPFKTAKIMVAHVNNIHGGKNKREQDSDQEHLCDICGKSYKTVKRLKGHVWAMHTQRSDAKTFKCSLCPATFAWQTSIYKHMKMMHDNKRAKQSRTILTKKQDCYPGIQLANRMQYFQQNIATNLVQNMVPTEPLAVNIVQNTVQ